MVYSLKSRHSGARACLRVGRRANGRARGDLRGAIGAGIRGDTILDFHQSCDQNKNRNRSMKIVKSLRYHR